MRIWAFKQDFWQVVLWGTELLRTIYNYTVCLKYTETDEKQAAMEELEIVQNNMIFFCTEKAIFTGLHILVTANNFFCTTYHKGKS